jgi:phospholipase/lecithinase/hemolysin
MLYLKLRSGDSYTATSFNISGPQPSASNPMGNPALGSGTYTRGENWVGYLTVTYNRTFIETYDFAVGGATINGSVVASATPMDVQITTLFEPKYSSATFWDGENSLFLVWIGINDIKTYVANNETTEIPILMSAYRALLSNMYVHGARKFMLVNIPPLDRSPNIVALGSTAVTEFASAVPIYNTALMPMMERFKAHNSGVRASNEIVIRKLKKVQVSAEVYDIHTYMSKVLDSPTSHGFINNTCENAATCIWQGSLHTMYSFNKLFAADMVPTLTKLGW